MAQTELLPLSGAERPLRTVSDAISRPLLDVILIEATDADDAARIIGRDELLLSECRRMLPVVQKLAQGVGYDGVYRILQPLVILFGAPEFGPGKEGDALMEAWTVIYGRALSKLNADSLQAAVDEWIQKGKPFFAKPSELHKLAEPHHLRANMVAWRMRRAVDLADKAWRETPSQTPEERQAMRDRLQGLMAELGASTAPPRGGKLASSPHQAAERLRGMAG